MEQFQISYDEIVANLHPLSPKPSQSRMRYAGYSIDPDGQRIASVELSLELPNRGLLALRFVDVWLNSSWGKLLLPDPIGRGVLIVDVRKWGREHPIVVVADDEHYRTIFGSKSVEVVSN